MEQKQPANRTHGVAFAVIWKTLGLGTLLTTIGSILLAAVFAVALDGCARVASKLKPSSANVAMAEHRR